MVCPKSPCQWGANPAMSLSYTSLSPKKSSQKPSEPWKTYVPGSVPPGPSRQQSRTLLVFLSSGVMVSGTGGGSSPQTPPRFEQRWERRIDSAKEAHRPRLKNWERDRFGREGGRAAAAFEALRDERHTGRTISREARDSLRQEDFWRHYEQRRVPVVVSGIPSHEGWTADSRWTLEQLESR